MNHFAPYRREISDAERAAAVQSVTPLCVAVTRARERSGGDPLVLAWMSDLHVLAPRPYPTPLGIYATHVDTSANLRLALTELAALEPAPDLLVLGGDLADSGCAGEAPADEYTELRQVLDEGLPDSMEVLPVMGNHDHADRDLTTVWHEAWKRNAPPGWPRPVETADFYYEHRIRGWRFLALDSRQGQPLSASQRAWLSDRLAEDDRTPSVVLAHRPFLCVGNWVDDFRLQDRATFDLLDASASVRAVLSGHTHCASAWSYRGKSHVIFPAVAYGIPDPIGWGVVVLGSDRVKAVFVKDLATTSLDHVGYRLQRSDGAWRELPPRPFETDPKFNPCLLPRDLPLRER